MRGRHRLASLLFLVIARTRRLSPQVRSNGRSNLDPSESPAVQDRFAPLATTGRVYSAASFGVISSTAARTRGGDIGSSVMRAPIAFSIALAIAAIGGQILTSPTPLA